MVSFSYRVTISLRTSPCGSSGATPGISLPCLHTRSTLGEGCRLLCIMSVMDGGVLCGGEGDDDEDDGERTTTIQHCQTLWLSRCSFGVGHSNSK